MGRFIGLLAYLWVPLARSRTWLLYSPSQQLTQPRSIFAVENSAS
jgi:hypothetical protein